MSSQYFVGDASNQAQQLPGYMVVNLHSSYQIDSTFKIYGRIDNVFNNHYSTYGTFFDTSSVPNFANDGAPFTDRARSARRGRKRSTRASRRRSEGFRDLRAAPPRRRYLICDNTWPVCLV